MRTKLNLDGSNRRVAERLAMSGLPPGIPMEWLDAGNWRLPSGKALAEFALQAGFLPHHRMPPIAANDEIGANIQLTVRRIGAHADDAAALLDQIGGVGLHAQIEGLVAFALAGKKIEEIPLRHQRDIFAAGRQMRHVDRLQARVADLHGEPRDRRMRQFQEFVEQAEFGYHFQRRGMDRVAAEIAKKILMLFQHRHVDAGAGQQEAEHHSGRAPADDTALLFERRIGHVSCPSFRPVGRLLTLADLRQAISLKPYISCNIRRPVRFACTLIRASHFRRNRGAKTPG